MPDIDFPFEKDLHDVALQTGPFPREQLERLATRLAATPDFLMVIDDQFKDECRRGQSRRLDTHYHLICPAICAMAAAKGEEAFRRRLGWTLADWLDDVDEEFDLVFEALVWAGRTIGPEVLHATRQKLLEVDLYSPAWHYLWGWAEMADHAPTDEIRASISETAILTAERMLAKGDRDCSIPLFCLAILKDPRLVPIVERARRTDPDPKLERFHSADIELDYLMKVYRGEEAPVTPMYDLTWIEKLWVQWHMPRVDCDPGPNELTPIIPKYDNPQSERVVCPIVNEEPKVGRNDPCPCGSGKKFKKCCGR